MVKELFLKIEKLEKTTETTFFDKLNETSIYFSYFQVDKNYYLFSYTNRFIGDEFFYQNLSVIQILDTRQRKLRSIRGFLKYALDIMEAGKKVQILNTNLKLSFWKDVKEILRQSDNNLLLQFVFKNSETREANAESIQLQELQTQMKALQKEINLINKKLDQTTNTTNKKKQTTKLSDSEKARFKKPSEITDEGVLEKYIKTGFQLNKDKKISLKEYYEGTGEDSLYQFAGISIKFETIRQKDLYKELNKLK